MVSLLEKKSDAHLILGGGKNPNGLADLGVFKGSHVQESDKSKS